MTLFQKFIIEDDCLIMMNVAYHSQIVTQKNKVNGGGWFLENELSNTYTLDGVVFLCHLSPSVVKSGSNFT